MTIRARLADRLDRRARTEPDLEVRPAASAVAVMLDAVDAVGGLSPGWQLGAAAGRGVYQGGETR